MQPNSSKPSFKKQSPNPKNENKNPTTPPKALPSSPIREPWDPYKARKLIKEFYNNFSTGSKAEIQKWDPRISKQLGSKNNYGPSKYPNTRYTLSEKKQAAIEYSKTQNYEEVKRRMNDWLEGKHLPPRIWDQSTMESWFFDSKKNPEVAKFYQEQRAQFVKKYGKGKRFKRGNRKYYDSEKQVYRMF